MRILIVHNHYGRFAQGGEANVMNAEAKLLAEHGHEVMKYERTNAELEFHWVLPPFKLKCDSTKITLFYRRCILFSSLK